MRGGCEEAYLSSESRFTQRDMVGCSCEARGLRLSYCVLGFIPVLMKRADVFRDRCIDGRESLGANCAGVACVYVQWSW